MRNIAGIKSYDLRNFLKEFYKSTKHHPKRNSILLYTFDSLANLYLPYELMGDNNASLSTIVSDVKL